MPYAKIIQGKGKYSKQYRFLLVADNHKALDPRDYYHNVSDLIQMLEKFFPSFDIRPDPQWFKNGKE